MKFFSLQERSSFSIHDPTGVKLLTRLWLKFSHFNEHKFRHDFKDTVVAMCDCGTETETTGHFFRCLFFVTERQKVLNNIFDKHVSSQNLNEKSMIDVLLHGCDKLNKRDNKEILFHTIGYTKSNKHFERPLIDHCLSLFYYYFYHLTLTAFFISIF